MSVTKSPYPFLVALCLLSFLGQGLYLVHWHTLTGDEATHVAAGTLFWRTGSFQGGFDNPPLVQTIFGLPYELGLATFRLLSSERPIAARLSNLLLGFLLCLSVAYFSYLIHGKWGALVSLALACLSPTLIAHSTIATLDVGLAVFTTVGLMLLYKGHQSYSMTLPLLSALCFGLALIAKYTALFIFPYILVLVLTSPWLRDRNSRTVAMELIVGTIIIWFCFSLAFGFRGSFVTKTNPNQGFLAKAVTWFLPSEGIETLTGKLKQARTSETTLHVFGKIRPSSSLYYLLIPFVKLVSATLFLLLWLLCRSLIFSKNELATWPYTVLPAGAFCLLFLFNKSYCGIRHLLPTISLVFVALGALANKSNETATKKGLLGLCLTLVALECAISFPHHMAYFNAFGRMMTEGPFVIGYCDTDYGQEDDIDSALCSLANDYPIYVCPAPSDKCRLGYVAVTCASLDRVRGYRWLKLFKPMRRLGKTWLLYKVEEQDYQRLLTRNPNSWPHIKTYLDYLLDGQHYEKLIKEASSIVKKQPLAYPYLSQAFIYSHRPAECLKLDFPQKFIRWKHLSYELIGNSSSPKLQQQARALLSLMELAPRHSKNFVEEFFASDNGYSLMSKSSDPIVRSFVGHQLFAEKRFAEAYQFLRFEQSQKAQMCKLYLQLTKAPSSPKLLFKFVPTASFNQHAPYELMSFLQKVHRQDPNNYWAIVMYHYFSGLQRRGLVNGGLEFGNVFSRVNREGRYLRKP